MDQEDQILKLFDEYFKNADKTEIEKDIKFINSLNQNGVSFEEYMDILNKSTSYSLIETGLCDDIAYAEYFNKLISRVTMDEPHKITLVKTLITVKNAMPNSWGPTNDNSNKLGLAA